MKSFPIFLVAATLATAPFLPAPERAPQAAFLNVVNLVGLREPTTMDLGGFRFNGGAPVATGETSGLLAIVPGSHLFTLENPGAKPDKLSLPLELEAGRTFAVICFDEVKVYRDGSEESKLRCTVLVEGEDEGARFSLVSLLKDPLVGVELSGAPVALAARQAHKAAVNLEDVILVTHKGRVLAEIAIDRPTHYLGFLFENPESGEVELSLLLNERLEYQPPLERDEDDDEP